MKDESPSLLPLSNERMASLLNNACHMLKRTELNVPLWSIVGGLTGHGSGYSAKICKEAGLDPFQIVRPNKRGPLISLPPHPAKEGAK
jgi:hypothetical protein